MSRAGRPPVVVKSDTRGRKGGSINGNSDATVIIIGILGVVSILLGFKFLNDHWEDIKTLAILALVLGGAFTIGGGGWWIASRRN